MTNLPTGTITLLFTDIEGSTRLLQQLKDDYATVLATQRQILRAAFANWHGVEMDTQGDSFFVVFPRALDAISAATQAQRVLYACPWPDGVNVRVRMGLHTGEPQLIGNDYVGIDIHRAARIGAVAYGGQVLLSQSTRDLVESELPAGVSLRDLGEHRLKDLRTPKHIFQLVIADLPTDFPPLKTLDPFRTNLPAQLTSFVGREKEMAKVKTLLSANRLVTLTGSGGTGKTRLSLQIAAEVLDSFKDGVWLIELAPLSDPAFVLNTVAAVLGVREETGRPLLATLMDWLSHRELLLVLDNCEHLIEACAQFADAGLHASRETRILATSREPLVIAGESAYRVPSLPAPDFRSLADFGSLMQYDAVQLFVERATQALSTFRMTNDNAPAIAQICFRLDGIPLAIELAAARVKALAVDKITERLDDRFRLLTGGSRTALPRQQTLRALIDWSYDLLSEPERVLLRRLSVFAGGWTLEAAEDVCADDDIVETSLVLARNDILDLLTRLVDKSLVVLDEQAAETRYRMLETIRQYAGEKLLDANEREQLRGQHLRFFVKLAEHTEPILKTAQRTVWLPCLESEHDNLRAALDWACERDVETARWLAGILERFWFFSDHLSEARTWYARVLNAGERSKVTKGLALSLFSSGCVSLNLEHLDEAQVSLESSVVLWQQLGDQQWVAESLAWLAYLLLQRGDDERARAIYAEHESLFRASGGNLLAWTLSCWGTANAAVRRDDPTAKALLDEALSLAHTLQDPLYILLAYSSLGDWAVMQADYAMARRHFLEALGWRRQLGTRWIIAAGLRQVANVMCLQGDYQQAEPLCTEALAMARALGDQHTEASIAQALGEVAIHLGDVERATKLLVASLSSFRKRADSLGIARCLMMLADLRQVQGQIEQAACVLGFVEPWLQSNQLQLVLFDRIHYERGVTAAHAQLDEATFNAVWEAGSKMTLEQAVAYALEDTH
jgi:predicted ATPase/class 3 adenylate cyclase